MKPEAGRVLSGPRHRELDRELLAAAALRAHPHAAVEQPGRLTGQQRQHVRPVLGTQVGRHDELPQRLPAGLLAGVAEQRLGRAVELDDPATGVDRDDGVERPLEHAQRPIDLREKLLRRRHWRHRTAGVPDSTPANGLMGFGLSFTCHL
jgi:hypothetical protein